MKKTYPKVPHHDHDTVDEDLYSADDLVLLEKTDGSNFRLCLYDSRYPDDLYGDQLLEFNPDDGDIFIGSKKTVRGRLSDSVTQLDGAFKRIVTQLRDELDRDALRTLHTEYDTPLLLFGEHMLMHSLDYNYDEKPPSAFLGFDVFRMDEYETPPGNPFKERFDGFLDLESAFSVFTDVGLEPIQVIDRVDDVDEVPPSDVTVPESAYGDVQAEGVVFRSDTLSRRTKLVTDEFSERMQESWGLREDQATSGAEVFVARYLTNARIRKTVQKLMYRHDATHVNPDAVTEAVVADAWEEELEDVQSMNTPITPRDVYSVTQPWVEQVIRRMHTNAQLNETTPDRIWEQTGVKSSETRVPSLTPPEDRFAEIVAELQESDAVERSLVRAVLSPGEIRGVADAVSAEVSDDLGKWVIPDVFEKCCDRVWYGELAVIANLPVAITPSEVNAELMSYLVTEIDAYVGD